MSKRRGYDLSLALLGTEWAAAVIGLTLLGLWLDRRFGTAPWAVIVGATIGFVGGTLNFVRAAQRAAREQSERERQSGDGR